MTKKADQITTHITSEQKEQALAVAKLRGFDNLSAYLCHLVQSDIDEQRKALESLAPIFGWEKNSDGSDRAAQFMRVLEEIATEERTPH
jgi:hypothetical protein